MVELQTNAQRCTYEMMGALESMVEGDANLALIYGNSAIAAVILLFQAHGIEVAASRQMFEELWSPITGSTIMLEG